MSNNKKNILILIILILGFGLLSHWQFKKFSQSLKEVNLPKMEMPEMELKEFFSPEKEGYKEWISPDGKLKINYPADWTEGEKELLKALNHEGVLENAKILFFAYKIGLEGFGPSFFTIQELNLTKLDEIIEKREKNTKERNEEMEIIKLEREDKFALLEVKYKRDSGYNFQAKEKIIFRERGAYLVALFTLEENWQAFSAEANTILNSIKFNQYFNL